MRHPILSRVPLVFLGTCFRWAVTHEQVGYPEGAIPRRWVSKGVQVASGDLKMQHILKHLTELTGERQQPFGTRLCLQSLVCYTLVPADAEKGLRANTASTCSVAEGCAGGHGS